MAWADDQSGEIKGATILDNQLSHLDNVAYKIKFFMIHSDHPIQGSELDEAYLKRVNSIIIAETGVTSGFYIKDVGFSNVVSARMQILPLGITGQLNIIEPYGMSFYEKLVIASAQLGIKSHLEARYIIQITFTGHKSDGGQIIVPFKWLVPVILKGITSTVTEQGSDYTLQWVGLNQKATMNISESAKEPMTVTARTFGEFLDEYTIQLNKHQDDLVDARAQKIADTYEFVFDPGHPHLSHGKAWQDPTEAEARKFKLGAADPENLNKNRRSQVFNHKAVEGPGAHHGVGIIKISANMGSNKNSLVEGVFMQTVEMKERTKPGGDASVTMSTKEFKKLSKKHKEIEGIADVGGNYEGWYDFKNKWYMTISTTFKNGEWDAIRNLYAKNYTKTLHKYRVLHALSDGVEFRQKIHSDNIKQTTIDKMNALTQYGLLRKAYYWIYTGQNTEVLNFNFHFDNLYYVATDTYPNSSLGSRTPGAGKGNFTTRKDKNTTLKDEKQSQLTENQFRAATAASSPSMSAKYILFKSGETDVTYMEDLDRMSIKNATPFSNPPYLPDIAPRDLITGTGAGGLTTVKDPNRIVYNINSGDAMELNLQIRGDPYWLGHTIGIVNTPEETLAPYSNGANYLYIEFNVPTGVDSDSGQMEMSAANNISGLYFIHTCQSNFSDGQFTQSLSGYLDTTFGLSVVRNILAEPSHFLKPTGGIQ